MGNAVLHTGKLRNMASVYLRYQDSILLLFRQGNSIVNNFWIGSAGGHFESAEFNDAKACVLRELYEELSIPADSLANLTLRYITLRYTDGEVRQNYYFFADLLQEPADNLSSSEGILQWFSPDMLSDLNMPITARNMVNHYIRIGQYNNCLYCGVSGKENFNFVEL